MSMNTTRILAIRHGETAWNVDTRIQGHLDIPLNAQGLRQAAHLAQALAEGDAVDAVYASDLSRAHATASAIAQALQQSVTNTRACGNGISVNFRVVLLPKSKLNCPNTLGIGANAPPTGYLPGAANLWRCCVSAS